MTKQHEQNSEALKAAVFARTGLKTEDLMCPHEKSEATPCVARDGATACTGNGCCVGCGLAVTDLLEDEKKKEGSKVQKIISAVEMKARSAAMLEAAKPLMKWLSENCNPHHEITVTSNTAELLSSEIMQRTDEFLKD